MGNPLDDVFNMDSEDDPFKDDHKEVVIPENPELDDIVRLALDTYKEQMDDVQHLEPKFRARNLEVSQQFLKLALDSLVKKKEMAQADRKIDIDEKVKLDKIATKGDDTPGDGTTQKTRKQLMEDLNSEG